MNLIDAIDTEIGTLPQPSFDLDTLIEHELRRRTRVRRIAIGAGAVASAALAATVVFASLPTHSTAEPTVSTRPTPSATPIPLPTQSWQVLPLPTGVPPSLDVTLGRIGPSLGMPAGTRFHFVDAGGVYKAIDTQWGSHSGPWGQISIDGAARVDKFDYSCATWTPCTEVTGADGSMTYVAGPIVGPEPSESPSAAASSLNPGLEPSQTPSSRAPVQPGVEQRGPVASAENDFVWSYHPDGTFVEIILDPEHEPAGLTIAQLVAAGLAFSAVAPYQPGS